MFWTISSALWLPHHSLLLLLLLLAHTWLNPFHLTFCLPIFDLFFISSLFSIQESIHVESIMEDVLTCAYSGLTVIFVLVHHNPTHVHVLRKVNAESMLDIHHDRLEFDSFPWPSSVNRSIWMGLLCFGMTPSLANTHDLTRLNGSPRFSCFSSLSSNSYFTMSIESVYVCVCMYLSIDSQLLCTYWKLNHDHYSES